MKKILLIFVIFCGISLGFYDLYLNVARFSNDDFIIKLSLALILIVFQFFLLMIVIGKMLNLDQFEKVVLITKDNEIQGTLKINQVPFRIKNYMQTGYDFKVYNPREFKEQFDKEFVPVKESE